MSFLQIDKKAVTEDEGNALLMQTYALEDPFGTPTLFLNPDDFSPHWLEKAPKLLRAIYGTEIPSSGKIEREIHDRIEDFIDRGILDDLDETQQEIIAKKLHRQASGLAEVIGLARLNPQVPKMTMRLEYRELNKAHCSTEEHYRPPVSGMVVTPQTSVSAEQMAKYFTGGYEGTSVDMPGTKSQHQFNIAWHEIGHGTGAAEPQTELMAGLATRKAFEDTRMLSMNADGRAVRAMFQHANTRPDITASTGYTQERNKYGWPMVEVNDYAAQLDSGAIDELGEETIKRLRFQKFDHQGDNLKGASDALKWEDNDAFLDRDLETLKLIATTLAEKRSTPPAHAQIYARFALACERLIEGSPAYDDAGEHEAEQSYMTFDPDQFNLG